MNSNQERRRKKAVPRVMVPFRCTQELHERIEKFSKERGIDRSSIIKLALHLYLNRHEKAEDMKATSYQKKEAPKE